MERIGEVQSSLRKWYTTHVHSQVYNVVVYCILFQQLI